MQALRLLGRIYKRFVIYVLDTIDYLSYAVEEFRNSERERGWLPDQMTTLLTAQEGTREEQELARQRREFWQRLMDEKKESNGSAVY